MLEMKSKLNSLLVLTCLLLVGCSGASKQGGSEQPPTVIGTGSPTGVYFPAGGAICKMVNRYQEGHDLRCVAESTRGSIDNIDRLRSSDIQFGIVQSDWQYRAYQGLDRYRDQGAFTELRSVFALHAEPVTLIVRKGLVIEQLSDVRGKRVNIGKPGSGTRAYWETMQAALGWSDTDVKAVSGLTALQTPDAICRNQIDAYFWIVGHPSAMTNEVLNRCPAQLVPIDDEVVKRLVTDNPELRKATIPARIYGTGNDIQTFGVGATLVTRANVPEDVVYTFVAAVFEHLHWFRQEHPALADLDESEMITDSLTAPLHPGAARYYRERGWLQ